MANGKILASINGNPITEADVDNFIAGLGQRGQAYQNAHGRQIVLDELINQKLLLLEANRNFYEADPEFKAELNRVKESILVSFAIKKAIEKVTVAEEEVKKFYTENMDQFMAGETVNASHILVDSEEKAKEIAEDIKSGKISFEDAAKQYSSCPSKEKGGNLGEFQRGQMVPEFDEACFTMEVGTMSEPIQTQFGYHIIKLNSKSESRIMEFDEVKAQLTEKVLNDKKQQAYQSKINQLKIMYPVDRY